MLIPPGFCNVIARYSNVMGHLCQNACGYSLENPLIQANVDALSDGLAIVYKAQLSTVSQWFGVVVDIGNDGPPLQLTSSSSSGVGSRGGDEPPAQVQGLIKKSTGFGGRAFRGRMYIPDLYESQINNNGALNSTALGLLNDIAGAWMDLPGFASANFGLPQLLHPSESPTEITAMSAEAVVATQRRRFPRS
jgi:hypothetical protein